MELQNNLKEKYFNEFGFIECTFYGMECLFSKIRKLEGHAKPIIGFETLYETTSNNMFIRNAFNWYSVSACNLVEVIGYIFKNEQLILQSPKNYVEKIVPEILSHRNKIAAHPVITRIDNRDSDVERQYSSMSCICNVSGRFMANYLMVTTEKESSANILPWSLTLEHERLNNLYGLSKKWSYEY